MIQHMSLLLPPPRVSPAPVAEAPPNMKLTVEMITAATIAAVDRHLASLGLVPAA